MCSELRVTKEHMREFIQGKPVPEECSVGPLLAKKPPVKPVRKPVVNPYRMGAAAPKETDIFPHSTKRNAVQTSKQTSITSFSQNAESAEMDTTNETAMNTTNETATTTNRLSSSSRTVSTLPPAPAPAPPPKPPNAFERLTTTRPETPRPLPRVFVPGPVPLAPGTISEWVYPVDDAYPKRQYQIEISKVAMLHNTLVSLPTGLGKTLIAAVVLYNYYRWFPTGKIIFLAPTLPLVNQQVKACYDIMGIPAEHTAVLTGKITAAKRTQIWTERRVFFCTPQTVQKDLETGRVDPVQVVCIVLDEAHKASGEYAYVKIVEYLSQSGAKFRVLGLSATPGTNIKAIQQVVDVLHINKIEARTEVDPTVSKYIHERNTEIVIVPQASAAKTIERALNDMMGPLLDKIRQAGGRITGNATVTSFQLLKARDDYVKRTNDERLSGHFFAAQTFCQLRADLYKHGVGVVRMKLSRLRTERQRGMLASIVRGTEFEAIWEQVVKATCDPNAKDATVHDKVANNPKLQKLMEILMEHFERARATSKSSRAIVFSQFRDSVSEIVSILVPSKPLIRPRHFVGQGKGPKGEGQLKGMNQAEQQRVIREFRENVYNVLVCTCIGEEGEYLIGDDFVKEIRC
jgi:Fanconi anemia group M protein